MDTMMDQVLSTNGFACGVEHPDLFSPYHVISSLFEFSMNSYNNNEEKYEEDASRFKSDYVNFGNFFTKQSSHLEVILFQNFCKSVTEVFLPPHTRS